MNRAAQFIVMSWGWQRRGVAFGAGALSALAMPPFFAFPLLWLTFPVLVWLLDGAVEAGRDGRPRRLMPAFRTGWWFGFGYFLAGLWWVGTALLVEAETFGWLLPVAVLALPAGLALFWGVGAAVAQLMWCEDWRRIFALAAGLGAAEWLRGVVLTGFPWNGIGYALTAGEVLMQSAALLSVEGLTFLAIAIFAAPAVLAGSGTFPTSFVLPLAAAIMMAGLTGFGVTRLAGAAQAYQPGMVVRIVQPNLDQAAKWDPDNHAAVLRTYIDLSGSEQDPLRPETLLVWPETAFPFPLAARPEALAAIGALLPAGAALATGAFRIDEDGEGNRRAANTLHVVDDTGTIQDSYDKVHLVPFGEYLPLGSWLDVIGLRQLAQSTFSAGSRPRLLDLPFGPSFLPLICYEIIFPGAPQWDRKRPGFLLNVTNDGWFGRTAGPHQHLHQARVRALEQGLPLVRAANTGISAITDAYGRIVARSGLAVATALDGPLPRPLPETPFGGFRRICAILLLTISLGLRFGPPIYYPVRSSVDGASGESVLGARDRLFRRSVPKNV